MNKPLRCQDCDCLTTHGYCYSCEEWTPAPDGDDMQQRVFDAAEHAYESGRRNMMCRVLSCYLQVKNGQQQDYDGPEELRSMFEEIEAAARLVAAVRAVTQQEGER